MDLLILQLYFLDPKYNKGVSQLFYYVYLAKYKALDKVEGINSLNLPKFRQADHFFTNSVGILFAFLDRSQNSVECWLIQVFDSVAKKVTKKF